jgi:hypothetical protein
MALAMCDAPGFITPVALRQFANSVSRQFANSVSRQFANSVSRQFSSIRQFGLSPIRQFGHSTNPFFLNGVYCFLFMRIANAASGAANANVNINAPDAWSRIHRNWAEGLDVAVDHGAEEHAEIAGQAPLVTETLARVPTVYLKRGLINNTVHLIRSGLLRQGGGGRTTAQVQAWTRRQVLREIAQFGAEDMCMFAVALEHSM